MLLKNMSSTNTFYGFTLVATNGALTAVNATEKHTLIQDYVDLNFDRVTGALNVVQRHQIMWLS